MIIATTDIKTMLATEAVSLAGTKPAVGMQTGAVFSALFEEENPSLSEINVEILPPTEPEMPPLTLEAPSQKHAAGDHLISPITRSEPDVEASAIEQEPAPDIAFNSPRLIGQTMPDISPQVIEHNNKVIGAAPAVINAGVDTGEVSNSIRAPEINISIAIQAEVKNIPITVSAQKRPQHPEYTVPKPDTVTAKPDLLVPLKTNQVNPMPLQTAQKPEPTLTPLPQPRGGENPRSKPQSSGNTAGMVIPMTNTTAPAPADIPRLPTHTLPQEQKIKKDSDPKELGVIQNPLPRTPPRQPSGNVLGVIKPTLTSAPVEAPFFERPVGQNNAVDAPPVPSQVKQQPQLLPPPLQPAPLPVAQNIVIPNDIIELSEALEGAVLQSPTLLSTDTKLDMSPMARPEVARHVAQQMARAVSPQSNRPIELTLNPEELGRLRMTLNLTDGGIAVVVAAERGETLDLLRRHISTLEQEFREMGYEDVSFSFSQENTTADNQNHESSDPSESNSNTSPNYQASPSEDAAPIQISLEAPTGLDLRF